MRSRRRTKRRTPMKALALMLGFGGFAGDAVIAGDGPVVCECQTHKPGKAHKGIVGHFHQSSAGTLGYGPPGLHPGWQGFGLGYHPGYGYGGRALGAGAEGGYPFYGGPGYPHPDPALNRLMLQAEPFPYFGGPGGPSPDHPHFYGLAGPLVAEKPVITIGDDRYDVGYGYSTGAVPYSEAVMAPFTTRAGTGGYSPEAGAPPPASAPSASTPPVPAPNPGPRTNDRSLGIDCEPAVDAAGIRGMRVTKVYPGTPADKAALRVDDVIHSINGYVTTQPGNLEWVTLKAAKDNILKMTVRTANDAKVKVIDAKLP